VINQRSHVEAEDSADGRRLTAVSANKRQEMRNKWKNEDAANPLQRVILLHRFKKFNRERVTHLPGYNYVRQHAKSHVILKQ
jgi:hypothetical protein